MDEPVVIIRFTKEVRLELEAIIAAHVKIDKAIYSSLSFSHFSACRNMVENFKTTYCDSSSWGIYAEGQAKRMTKEIVDQCKQYQIKI